MSFLVIKIKQIRNETKKGNIHKNKRKNYDTRTNESLTDSTDCCKLYEIHRNTFRLSVVCLYLNSVYCILTYRHSALITARGVINARSLKFHTEWNRYSNGNFQPNNNYKLSHDFYGSFLLC